MVITGMSVVLGLVGVGAQSMAVTGLSLGLGALSPGMGDSEYGGTGSVTGPRRVAGSEGLHTLRYKGVTAHGVLCTLG